MILNVSCGLDSLILADFKRILKFLFHTICLTVPEETGKFYAFRLAFDQGIAASLQFLMGWRRGENMEETEEDKVKELGKKRIIYLKGFNCVPTKYKRLCQWL